MKNIWKAAAVGAGMMGMLAATAAYADDMYATAVSAEGKWEVRLRGVYLEPKNDSRAVPALAVPRDAIHINDKWLPDLDIEYFFTPHWSTELVLTYPQTQDVTVEKSALGGPTPIGTFKHLPPILTGKYNFNPDGMFRPYFGIGVNYTLIWDVSLNVPTVGPLTLDNHSIGPAAQVGMDVKVKDHWFLNVDIKWAEINSDLYFKGAEVSRLQLNPWLFGVGIGYRFGGSPAPAMAPPPPPPPPVAAAPPPPPPPPPPPRHVTFSADALFTFDSAALRPEGGLALDKFASDLRGTMYNHIQVIGYTDRIGSDAYNLRLSRQRADSVKAYLVDKGGVDAGKIETEGRGKADPVTKPDECGAKRSPATIACLQPDRRVGIEVSGTQR
jgi:outer membrane protein